MLGETVSAGRLRTLTILVADDHPLVLKGLRRALEEDGGFEIVAETQRGSDVVSLVGRTNPDVALLDMRMPDIDGLTCLDRIHRDHPGVKVVICSAEADPEQVQYAFRRGASGYVVKNVCPRDLASALRQAVQGTAYHAHGLPAMNVSELERATSLTSRELEILRAVARGLSNKAIADDLWITEQTVKFHLGNVFRKLALSNRTEAARWALDNGVAPSGASDGLASAL